MVKDIANNRTWLIRWNYDQPEQVPFVLMGQQLLMLSIPPLIVARVIPELSVDHFSSAATLPITRKGIYIHSLLNQGFPGFDLRKTISGYLGALFSASKVEPGTAQIIFRVWGVSWRKRPTFCLELRAFPQEHEKCCWYMLVPKLHMNQGTLCHTNYNKQTIP